MTMEFLKMDEIFKFSKIDKIFFFNLNLISKYCNHVLFYLCIIVSYRVEKIKKAVVKSIIDF